MGSGITLHSAIAATHRKAVGGMSGSPEFTNHATRSQHNEDKRKRRPPESWAGCVGYCDGRDSVICVCETCSSNEQPTLGRKVSDGDTRVLQTQYRSDWSVREYALY